MSLFTKVPVRQVLDDPGWISLAACWQSENTLLFYSILSVMMTERRDMHLEVWEVGRGGEHQGWPHAAAACFCGHTQATQAGRQA